MKKSIIVSFVLLLSGGVSAQIKSVEDAKEPTKMVEIGAINPGGINLVIKCERTEVKDQGLGEYLYMFSYRDMQYQQLTEYKSFVFADIDNAFEDLYNIIINGIDTLPEEAVVIEIGDGNKLHMSFKKFFGKGVVDIWHKDKYETPGKIQTLSKKQVQKLFGKR